MPSPMVVNDSIVAVPVSRSVQYAWETWLVANNSALEKLFKPYGIAPTDLLLPKLEQVVYERENVNPGWVDEEHHWPDDRGPASPDALPGKDDQ